MKTKDFKVGVRYQLHLFEILEENRACSSGG